MPDDVVRLTVPADADMGGVVVAAVAAVVRAAGVGDARTARAREEAAEAFLDVLANGTGAVVTLTARSARHEFWFELHRGGRAYTAHAKVGD
jgi:hypothetical protein